MSSPFLRPVRFSPGLLRFIAGVSFLAGGFLIYLDAQDTALRRLALALDAPPPRAIAEVIRDGAGNLLGEVSVRSVTEAPRLVTYRQGLQRRTVVVYPLTERNSGTVQGFAYVPPSSRGPLPPDSGAEAVILQGLLGAPSALKGAAAKRLAEEGLQVAPDALGLALYDSPRNEVLSRAVHSPWRPVLFWLASVALIASLVLQIARRRAAAERNRMALEGDRDGRQAASVVPRTAKARSRFHQLAETDEPTEASAVEGGLSRLMARARALVGAATVSTRHE